MLNENIIAEYVVTLKLCHKSSRYADADKCSHQKLPLKCILLGKVDTAKLRKVYLTQLAVANIIENFLIKNVVKGIIYNS